MGVSDINFLIENVGAAPPEDRQKYSVPHKLSLPRDFRCVMLVVSF